MSDILRRAIELAPECGTMAELRKKLAKEGFPAFDHQLQGLGTQRQLRSLFNGGLGQRKRGIKVAAKD